MLLSGDGFFYVLITWSFGQLALLAVVGAMVWWTRNAKRQYKDQQVILLDQKPAGGIVVAWLLTAMLLTLYIWFIPWVVWQAAPFIPLIFCAVPFYALLHYAVPRLRFWIVNESTIIEQLFSTKKTMGWYEIERIYYEKRKASTRSIEYWLTRANEYLVLRSLDGGTINLRLNAFQNRNGWGYVERIIEQRLPALLRARAFRHSAWDAASSHLLP